MADRQRIQVQDEIELEMPDGSVYRVRPGPYGKGVSLVQAPQGLGSGGGKRGRKPRPGTVKLRERLTKDAAKDDVKDAAYYVQWMQKHDPDVDPATARQIVYRERRRAGRRPSA